MHTFVHSERKGRKTGWLLCFCWVTLILSLPLPGQEHQVGTGSKTLPLPGESFRLDGHDAFVILPPSDRLAKADVPWVWYAPTLPKLPSEAEVWMFERFLKAGIAIAGIDVGESYGSPSGREVYSKFHHYLTANRHFSSKPVLLARSRGGLMLYSWAADKPEFVGGIAGIYPVCNLASYPGLERSCSAYGLTVEQLKSDLERYNPIDRLTPLAHAQVPIFHIHGDDDKVVPLEANSAIVKTRYDQLGGTMTLEVVKGQGHNMWTGWFENQQLVEFVITNATR